MICQRLVRGIVSRALQGMPVTWHVYLDDVLVTARSKGMAASAIRKAAAALRDAGFIISPKSEMEPSTEITFLGKRLDSVARSITNTSGMLVLHAALGASAGWRAGNAARNGAPTGPPAVAGQATARDGPVLGRVLPHTHAGSDIFTRSLARSTATVLVMAFPKHLLQQ